MSSRAIDVVLAAAVLSVTAPLLAIGALAVRVSSPGPVFYRARRVGRGGSIFHMLKLRTMHVDDGSGPVITSGHDPRVFAAGRVLRKFKIDELPQLANVLRGEMALVGPRPEDPGIVARAYRGWMRETLETRPGVTSSGTLHYYAIAEDVVDAEDPEADYIARLLAPKLAIDRAYMTRATAVADLGILMRTAAAVVARTGGAKLDAPRRDRAAAARWLGRRLVRPRILLTHRYYPPDGSPYGAILALMAEALARGHHEVHVHAGMPTYRAVAAPPPRYESRGGVRVRRMCMLLETHMRRAAQLVNSGLYVVSLSAAVLRLRPDVVTAATFPPVIAAWAALRASQLVGARFLYHVQDIHPEISWMADGASGRATNALRALDTAVLRRADRIVTLSEDMADTLRARVGGNALPILVRPNPPLEAPLESPPQGCEAAVGVRRIIFAGNLGRFQDLHALVDGIVQAIAKRTDYELCLMGDGVERAALERRWSSQPRVRFLPFLPFSQAQAVIGGAEIGLVSLKPGLEALAYPSKIATYHVLGLRVLALVDPDAMIARDVRAAGGAVPLERTPHAIAAAMVELLDLPPRVRTNARRDEAERLADAVSELA